MTPTFVPELKIPVASERSFGGNHSATVLTAAGEVAGFAKSKEEARGSKLQNSVGQGMAHCRKAPQHHHQHIADARANLSISRPATSRPIA